MLFFGANLVQAQSKIGHVSTDSLLILMPERDSADKKLQAEQKKYEDQWQKMSDELQKKQMELQQAIDAKASPAIIEINQDAVMQLDQRMQNFRQKASEDLAKRQTELYEPVIAKLKKAIADVAKEKGYTYVLDSSQLLYSSPSDDLMDAVKKKLGLK